MKKIIIGMFIIAGVVQAFPSNKNSNIFIKEDAVKFVPAESRKLVFDKEGYLFTGTIYSDIKDVVNGSNSECVKITEIKNGYMSGLEIIIEKESYKELRVISYIGNLQNGPMKLRNQYLIYDNGRGKDNIKITEEEKKELDKKIEKLINDYKKKQR
ncbi:hypothetical protein VSU16_14950 (plasmid) [Cetobacterium somerae]|uniref:hypothetical protein n=1 Tax=Cetobacterium somerae TaxID=188913 RepID=UPI002E7B1F01|nr:hypothetical protein [Cetobacterium somerae]WVJ03026.1 hypothetical protein VSU16_14950 [Cetobacterium somerae]